LTEKEQNSDDNSLLDYSYASAYKRDTYTIHHYYEEKEFKEYKKTWYYFIFDNDKPSLESRFEKIQRRLSDPYLSVDEVGKKRTIFAHKKCIKAKGELNVD
jgi:hypothetical protein